MTSNKDWCDGFESGRELGYRQGLEAHTDDDKFVLGYVYGYRAGHFAGHGPGGSYFKSETYAALDGLLRCRKALPRHAATEDAFEIDNYANRYAVRA